MGFTSAGVTKLVARLEAKELIHRTRDPADGRALLVTLTPHGERRLRKGLEAHIPRLDADLLQQLTPAQRRQLHGLLVRLDPTLRPAGPQLQL